MSTRRAGILLVLAVAASGVLSCRAPRPPQGIVLITLDTTRADRLGCYGYEGADTANLDALAREGVLFLEVQAPTPVTLPSHASMFTGQYPPVHGIRYNGMFRLEDSSVTVAELLGDAGWTTAGIPAAFPVAARSGIGQGFEIYRDMFVELDPKKLRVDSHRLGAETSDLGIEFLHNTDERPFFLWLHYWDPHNPYRPPFPFSSRYRERPYDGEIAYMDQQLGRFFEALREAELWDRVLLIVAGDHGEGLYEHSEKLHANLVYQSTLRVPLIVKPPGSFRPRTLEEPVSLVDIAPTILDFAGVKGPEMEGISLKPAIYGKRAPRRSLYFESLAGSLVYGWSPLEGLRRGAWKYTRSSLPELFNLESDPSERENVHALEGETASELASDLEQMENHWAAIVATASAAQTPVDKQTLEMLAALGYLGGFMTEERRHGPHPRDMIQLEGEFFALRAQMFGGDYAGALARSRRLLERDPHNRYVLDAAARAAVYLARLDLAQGFAERALDAYPEFLPTRILHGEIHVARGEIDQAADIFRKGLEYQPDDEGLNYRLAVALHALGRLEEAQAIVDRRVASEGPVSPSFLVVRASCRAKLGDHEGALEALGQAIEEGYRDRNVLETEPLLEALRAVPGFDDVLRTIPSA